MSASELVKKIVQDSFNLVLRHYRKILVVSVVSTVLVIPAMNKGLSLYQREVQRSGEVADSYPQAGKCYYRAFCRWIFE